MIIRLRSRDGLERITVPDGAGVAALKAAIQSQLGVAPADMTLSKDAALLTAKAGPEGISLLPDGDAPLSKLGVAHGDMLFMAVGYERQVEPAVQKTVIDRRQFGVCVSVHDIAAKQRRIERQDKAKVESVSFDRNAANVFQSYVQVDFLAELFGLKKVGWVFSQSNKERDYIISGEELVAMAGVQGELGEQSVTVVVSFDPNEQGGHVHFEAFQCSQQAVDMAREGWLSTDLEGALKRRGKKRGGGGGGDGGGGGGGGGGAAAEEAEEVPSPGAVAVVNPREPDFQDAAIVAGKDSTLVDTDWFLCPLKILDHEGPFTAGFPVENRLIPQTKNDLRDHLRRAASKPYEARLADFHLLLWLARQPNMDPGDMLAVVDAVRSGQPLMEGYRVIIDSLAGL
ncbi:hypothetical protein Rsub_04862 [Raphidocelis subcapitata]|uniref:Nuclear pore localisation protein Npl4 ubiquitin-like domain-containing protein n=1 Tax=Raphidocelis subcapitata TaxID=307507 RepID=A0A2V0P022_9CHLO|nr:hypothetical protein Rsub_04862 [Raphidocelis subcapitata]|eukprot:GBF91193.1 hypothetical protein Rsub_04862 [Raphidocelis subcapitata]